MKGWIIISFSIITLLGCSTTKTSQLISDNYDNVKDETSLSLIPYGNINIPGEWIRTKYNEISRQHFFVNRDSVSIAVTKNPQNKYPFHETEMNEEQFIEKYFIWEKNYYEKQNFNINRIKEKTGVNFIIWTATGDDVNSIFLYGAKDNFCYNFSVLKSKWDEDTKIDFLISLFETN